MNNILEQNDNQKLLLNKVLQISNIKSYDDKLEISIKSTMIKIDNYFVSLKISLYDEWFYGFKVNQTDRIIVPLFQIDMSSFNQIVEGNTIDITISISSNSGLLIIEPDIQLSFSTIKNTCSRQLLLSRLQGNMYEPSEYQASIGNAIHELFQYIIETKNYDDQDLQFSNFINIYSKGFTKEQFENFKDSMDLFNTKVKNVINKQWLTNNDYNTKSEVSNLDRLIQLCNEFGTNIPLLGINGKVDMLLYDKTSDSAQVVEVKTGKDNAEHDIQLQFYIVKMLYFLVNLYIQDGNKTNINSLLINFKEENVKEVYFDRKVFNNLIIARNSLATDISTYNNHILQTSKNIQQDQQNNLPNGLIKHGNSKNFKCKYCDYNYICKFQYTSKSESITKNDVCQDYILDNLDETVKNYINFWLHEIDKEQIPSFHNPSLFTMLSDSSNNSTLYNLNIQHYFPVNSNLILYGLDKYQYIFNLFIQVSSINSSKQEIKNIKESERSQALSEMQDALDQNKIKYIKIGSEIFVSLDQQIDKTVFIGYAKVESFEDHKISIKFSNIQTNIFTIYTAMQDNKMNVDLEDIGRQSSMSNITNQDPTETAKAKQLNKNKGQNLDMFKIRLDIKTFSDQSQLSKNSRKNLMYISRSEFMTQDIQKYLVKTHDDLFYISQEKKVNLKYDEIKYDYEQIKQYILDQIKNYQIPDEIMLFISSAIVKVDQNQIKVIRNCLDSTNLNLIHGMPGAGKTTCLALLIVIMQITSKNTLIITNTHYSLQNLVKKVLSTYKPALFHQNNLKQQVWITSERSISLSKILQYEPQSDLDIKDEIEPIHLEETRSLLNHLKSQKQKGFVMACNVWQLAKLIPTIFANANTKDKINVELNLFQLKIFDFAVVEEASQIFEPLALGALQVAQQVCMVGDHMQMSPITTNQESSNLQVSLFERMIVLSRNKEMESQINSSVLSYQYRYNSGITELANQLTQEGSLSAANEEVRGRRIVLTSDMQNNPLEKYINANQDLQFLKYSLENFAESVIQNQSLNPNELFTTRILRRYQESSENILESNLLLSLIDPLVKQDQANSIRNTILILTPYNAHKAQIKKQLQNRQDSSISSQITVKTIDSCQGDEQDVVQLCLCDAQGQIRSDKYELDLKISEGHRSMHTNSSRLNVALTRARKKIVIIGCQSLTQEPNLGLQPMLFKQLNDKGYVVDLNKQYNY